MNPPQLQKSWIVSISTFPPRECGIATFTRDLSAAFNDLFAPGIESRVVAINIDDVTHLPYPKEVIAHISQSRRADYAAVAEKLNAMPHVKLVTIQHEFGIFGGRVGAYVLDFARTLTKPLAITFHTILPQPKPSMLRVVRALSERADMVIAMTHTSQKILETVYGVRKEKIFLVPHGIHPVPLEPSRNAKVSLGLAPNETVLSTFGLLNRGKGIEYVIDALPPVIKKYPQTRYLIIGATHPVILRKEGESYRLFLIQRIHQLGLTPYVRFYDEYLKTKNLLEFLSATDVYLATQLDPNQAISGTLSYALGAGRPVIATAFAQAKEVITPNVGMLVDFKNSKQITAALLELLGDQQKQASMGRMAYFKTRNMTWPNVAITSMRTFSAFVPELRMSEKRAPQIKLSHLIKMTDDFGMIQFAKMTQPDLDSGYTVDDNARALVFTVRYTQHTQTPVALRLAEVYLKFLSFVRRPDGAFENYVTGQRQLSHKQNRGESLEDANGRTLYALAVAATTTHLPKAMREKARLMYASGLPVAERFTYPRATALYIKSLALFLGQHQNEKYLKNLAKACNFLAREYKKHSSSEWQWFEPILTYSNAMLSEALLAGYACTKNPEYLKIGTQTLDFLISHTFENNMYVPIGQGGWFKRGGVRHKFDQQSEDTVSTIEALKTAHEVTKDSRYLKLMHRSFDWFLGDNLLGQVIYDHASGGCYDGVGKHEVNLNEGAESTLSYLLSRLLISSK